MDHGSSGVERGCGVSESTVQSAQNQVHLGGVSAQARMGEEEEEGAAGGSTEYPFVHQERGGVYEEVEKNLDEPSAVLESENGAFQQRMWGCFQNCARAVAQVYMTSRSLQSSSESTQQQQRDAQPQDSESPASRTPSPQPTSSKPPQQVEESFKSAAQHATSLYKDSIETSRRLIDLAIKTGSNRRTKEVLAFVRNKKKRFIKREELISYLVGCGGGSKKEPTACGGANGGRGKNHIGAGGGGFDVGYSHVLHHVHSGGGGGFSQGVNLSQQQSHQQSLHLPSAPQPQQPPQQSSQPHNLRLLDPAFPPFTSSLFTPRKLSSDFHPNASTPQRLVISSSNNSFEDNDPSSMLHLAVQQLFVAGAGINGGGANELVHVAGVKRPATDDGRKREEDEEDCMMEDSVDGGNDCFKRMRF